MDQINKTRTKQLAAVIPKIAEAGLTGNKQRLELLCLNTIRSFRQDYPELATQLGTLLSSSGVTSGVMRLRETPPPPSDPDAGLALLRFIAVDTAEEPVLPAAIHEIVSRFLQERLQANRLLSQGFAPPRTLLLKGPPGTGKTMLAEWIASQLDLRLVVLDLATSISSFLGKTGSNLKRSLDYARSTECVFLLDEFDSIGKRRDDITDIGELKRIVNVLLKELEEWPLGSVLIAATNHPELLDPAIHRRFDVVLETPLPSPSESERIISRASGRFAQSLPSNFLRALALGLTGRSGSELTTLAQSAVRRHVLTDISLMRSFVETALLQWPTKIKKKNLGALMKHLQADGALTVRDIAGLTGKSPSTVQYHLAKESDA